MFQFEIHGPLKVQKQTRWANNCAYDPSKKDKEMMQWQIKPFAPQTLITGPVELTIAFFFPVPKSASKLVRTQMLNRLILPDKRPDEDNLAYIVTNALKNLVYDDDCRVCAKHVYKFYGEEPKTVIRVRPILQAETMGYRDADHIRA